MDNIYSTNIRQSRVVSHFLLKDAFCKGFPAHTPKARAVWELLLNCLLESFIEEFGSIRIIRNLPQTVPTRFLEDFYKESFDRIADRIPNYINEQGTSMSVLTDALPVLFSTLDKRDILFSTYTVVRPRSFGVKPFLRDEFIRYFQFVIPLDRDNLDYDLNKLQTAIMRFFYRIRIPVITVDRHSDSYYSKKSCLHALWINGNIESVLQCGILKKQPVSNSGEKMVVVEVGGAQRLLATFIYNNSDIYGLFLPHHLRDYDIIIRSEQSTGILDAFVNMANAHGCRLLFVSEQLPLKKIRRMSVTLSAVAILVKRFVDNHEFLTIYNRDFTVQDLHSNLDISEWVSFKYEHLDSLPYQKQQVQITSRIEQGKLYYKNSNKHYTIIENGLFD